MRRLLLACLLGVAGCATQEYVLYQPGEEATASLSGYPAARYAIPPESPHGSVRVASFGVTWLDTAGFEPVRTMHVRLLVVNNDDEGPWDLDSRDLRVIFRSGATVAAGFVNASAHDLPLLHVPPGRKACVDAYFVLPSPYDEEDSVPAFDLAWKVRTPDRVVSERTPFERRVLEPEAGNRADTVYRYGLGFAPYWWYDERFAPQRVVSVRPPRVYVGIPRGR